ncbi:alanine--glyoxylate aminotransferase family protein [Paenibacillus barcinonensis]|uniref:(S)-ureidoglycine-glyoxylate aminotransferase n=1 Tax=Paenibacillus barcinonensis TaxID=198119 RepID=A0A2V4VRA6_PAEBA|nr:alanine--glyoxylate aminotransferase family protein [Paenibacillus barcinonensis]PYE49140.1 (S)-ureidoglycine-glyoxylate aminotransferase [Paenibacillus barcinonensis]QKS55379.1 alanine--glyoxylate aminotransferase family protein [Paenibacillus barcinonensis]
MAVYKELSPSLRTIMTPGPVEVDPRVLRAMSFPVLGQFDPEFTSLMNETMAMLRELYMTNNVWSYPVDGTSRSGIEAVLVSLIQPGDKVLVPVYGRFGYLLVEISERCGAEVVLVETEWGRAFDPEELIQAIHLHKPKLVAMVHGETSTGQMQPLADVGKVCRELDILLVVDAVATIGGTPVETDAWYLDAVIGGTQKCLSVPSGMAPLTYNRRVEQQLISRKTIERGLRDSDCARAGERTIASNYLDLSQLQDYWGPARLNHHTEATSMLYGLYEGLRIVLLEGLEARYLRHRINEQALMAGIEGMGLALYGDLSSKLPVVSCIKIPQGIDGERVRRMLLHDFGIEIASSFGPLKGKIWRIGTMGFSCQRRNVLHVLGALEAVLRRHGYNVSAGEAVQAALDVYAGKEKEGVLC